MLVACTLLANRTGFCAEGVAVPARRRRACIRVVLVGASGPPARTSDHRTWRASPSLAKQGFVRALASPTLSDALALGTHSPSKFIYFLREGERERDSESACTPCFRKGERERETNSPSTVVPEIFPKIKVTFP